MSDANLDYFARLFEGESHDCFVSVKIFHGEEQRPCDAVSISNSNDGVEEGRVFRLEGASRERRQARRSGRKFLVEERRIMTRLIMISVNRPNDGLPRLRDSACCTSGACSNQRSM